ncbi:MAG TPA: MFS transporter [Leeuwenhoekiella sp.]|nr:MFS transporter [Leeuwenhoekiella sp.]
MANNSSRSTIPPFTFAGLFFATMSEMMGMGILLLILPNLAKSLGASGTVVGIVFAGFALARGIFGPVFGRISDRYGRKKMMLSGLLIYALLSIGFILFLHHLIIISVLWFLQGMASAMVTPIAQSYIGDLTPKGKEGRIMNLFYLGQFGGIAIGPALGGYLVDHFNRTVPFYVMGGAALIGFLLVLIVVPPGVKKQTDPSKGMQFKKSVFNVFKDQKIKGILYYIVGRGFYRWGFSTFFPIYAVSQAALSKEQVGLVISSYMISGAVLQYPFGWVADRFQRYRSEMVLIGGLIAAATTFFVPVFTHLSWLIVLVVIMGIFSAASRASSIAIRTDRGRVHGMGGVTGVFMSGLAMGQVLGPVGFGAITDFFNIEASFYFGAGIGLLTTVLAYWFLRKNNRREKRISKKAELQHSA